MTAIYAQILPAALASANHFFTGKYTSMLFKPSVNKIFRISKINALYILELYRVRSILFLINSNMNWSERNACAALQLSQHSGY